MRLQAALIGLLATVAVGCGEQQEPSAIRPSANKLAQLRKEDPDASRLLDGGKTEFRRRLAAARARPVVVNQWASWCGPCRQEFPLFQRVAEVYRGRVGFLGVDAKDNDDDARRFLAEFPTPYPHIKDPDASVSRLFRGGRLFPTTAFYDSAHKLAYTHPGAYLQERQLAGDIRRYALHG